MRKKNSEWERKQTEREESGGQRKRERLWLGVVVGWRERVAREGPAGSGGSRAAVALFYFLCLYDGDVSASSGVCVFGI
jgi:hypothetical protein